ncbi:MAG: hypothetical protein V3U50_02935 [Acidimicrobiia bacterium]
MNTRTFAIAAVLALLSTPAFAYHCTKDIAQIDKALAAGPDLSTEQIAEVEAWRDEGESLHRSGKHRKAVNTLAKALDMLKLKKKSSGYTY